MAAGPRRAEPGGEGTGGGLCSGFGLGICQPGQHSSRGLRGDHPSRPDSVCTCRRSAAGGAGQTLALSASAWRALGWLRRSCELGLQGRQMALRGRGRAPAPAARHPAPLVCWPPLGSIVPSGESDLGHPVPSACRLQPPKARVLCKGPAGTHRGAPGTSPRVPRRRQDPLLAAALCHAALPQALPSGPRGSQQRAS